MHTAVMAQRSTQRARSVSHALRRFLRNRAALVLLCVRLGGRGSAACKPLQITRITAPYRDAMSEAVGDSIQYCPGHVAHTPAAWLASMCG